MIESNNYIYTIDMDMFLQNKLQNANPMSARAHALHWLLNEYDLTIIWLDLRCFEF